AYAYRQAAAAYAEARVALPEGAAKDRLGELERLFAVEWLARNSGDLLAAGRLSGDQVEALARDAEDLIAAVAAHAPQLADSFALPEALLADWPIAGPDYADAYDDPEGPWNTGAAEAR
ncbi:acyl-CoA dehydrogenase, partial [[Kitasatospora] papulosa]